MRKIKAYQLPCVLKKAFITPLPAGIEILCVQVIKGMPVMSGVIDDADENERDRVFRIYGNDEEIKENAGIYVGSFVISGKVSLHLFDITPLVRHGPDLIVPR